MFGFVILGLLKIWIDRRWPDSRWATAVMYVYSLWFLAWFGSKVVKGYRRRKPYWTGDSWRRYLRLVAMPVLALVLLFTELFLTDINGSGIVFGAPRSALRTVWVLIDLALMGLGAVGLSIAVDWMSRGEPSEQFTRTRWFRRGGTSAIAD